MRDAYKSWKQASKVILDKNIAKGSYEIVGTFTLLENGACRPEIVGNRAKIIANFLLFPASRLHFPGDVTHLLYEALLKKLTRSVTLAELRSNLINFCSCKTRGRAVV